MTLPASRFHFDDDVVWPLLIYWLVLFVACFVLVEIGHDQLYDQVTPRGRLEGRRRVARACGPVDGATGLRFSGVVRVDVHYQYWLDAASRRGLVPRFHVRFSISPVACAWAGVVTMILVSGLATMGVESVLAKKRDVTNATRPFVPTEPVRQSLGRARRQRQPKRQRNQSKFAD